MPNLFAPETSNLLFLPCLLNLIFVFGHSSNHYYVICLSTYWTSSVVVLPPVEQSVCITHIFWVWILLCSISFSMSLITLPYIWQSAMNRNIIAKNFSAALILQFNCLAVGTVTPSFFSTALEPHSICPMPSPSWSHTYLTAVNWYRKFCNDCPLYCLIHNRIIVCMTWLCICATSHYHLSTWAV